MKKMNEKEMSINLKSIKISWFYTVVALFLWSTFDWVQNRRSGLPFILLITQSMVLLGTRLYLERKISKDEKQN